MVELTWQGDVAVITMADGENRFDDVAVARWHALLDDLEGRDGPLALVTTGVERFYSNGLDLDWMGGHPEDAGPMIRDLHRLWGRVLAFPGITVAAVNGHAFGAGALHQQRPRPHRDARGPGLLVHARGRPRDGGRPEHGDPSPRHASRRRPSTGPS